MFMRFKKKNNQKPTPQLSLILKAKISPAVSTKRPGNAKSNNSLDLFIVLI